MHKKFEEEFIGLVLEELSSFYEVSDIVKPKHLKNPLLKDIYNCIGLCVRKGRPLEHSVIASYVTAKTEIDIADYLVLLRNESPGDGNAVEWARMIRDDADLNDIEKVLKEGVNRKVGAGEFLDGLLNRLIMIRSGSDDGSITLFDSVRKEIDRIDERYRKSIDFGWEWGIPGLSDIIGLIRPGELYTLAAPSGMGKTSIAMQIAYEVAKTHWVEVFQVDIAEHEQARKTLTTLTGIPVRKIIQSRSMDDDEVEKLIVALDDVPRKINMNLMRDPMIENVRMKCLVAKERGDLALIIADHSKLFGTTKKTYNEFQTLMEVYKEAKKIALETGAAFIMLNQIVRDFNKANTWKLKKHHIWGGENAAENSGCVLLLNRPESIIRNLETGRYYSEEKKNEDLVKWEGLGYIEAAKNRYGPEGARVVLNWDAERTLFYKDETEDYDDDLPF